MGNSATVCCVLCCVGRGIELTHSYPVKPNVCHTMCIGALYHDDVHPGIERPVGGKGGRSRRFYKCHPFSLILHGLQIISSDPLISRLVILSANSQYHS